MLKIPLIIQTYQLCIKHFITKLMHNI